MPIKMNPWEEIRNLLRDECVSGLKSLAENLFAESHIHVILCQLSTWSWADVVEVRAGCDREDAYHLLDPHLAAIIKGNPSVREEIEKHDRRDGGIWASPLYNNLSVIRSVVWPSEIPGDYDKPEYHQMCVAIFGKNSSPEALAYLMLLLARRSKKIKLLWQEHL